RSLTRMKPRGASPRYTGGPRLVLGLPVLRELGPARLCCPLSWRTESNTRTRFRKPVLYPLSYGANNPQGSAQAVRTPVRRSLATIDSQVVAFGVTRPPRDLARDAVALGPTHEFDDLG